MKRSILPFVRFIFIIWLLLVLFSYAMFQGGFVSWFLFFSFLPISISLIGLYLYPTRNWRVTRKLSTNTAQSGDSINVTITAKRGIPFPLAYCLIDDPIPSTTHIIYDYINRSTDYDKEIKAKGKQIFFPWFKRTIQFTYRIDHIPRGVHNFTSVRLEMGDLFGFIQKEKIIPLSDELTVYPRERTVILKEKIEKNIKRFALNYSEHTNQTNTINSIREYVAGDHYASIDWKQTAKKNKLMTKEFEREQKRNVHIMLNTVVDEVAHHQSFEKALELAYALTKNRQLKGGKKIFSSLGGRTYSFDITNEITLQEELIHHFVYLQPTNNSFLNLNRRILKQVNHATFLLFITTQLDISFRKNLLELYKCTRQIIVIYVTFTNEKTPINKELLVLLKENDIKLLKITGQNWKGNVIEVNVS